MAHDPDPHHDVDSMLRLPSWAQPLYTELTRAYTRSGGEIEVFVSEPEAGYGTIAIRPDNVHGQLLIGFDYDGSITMVHWDDYTEMGTASPKGQGEVPWAESVVYAINGEMSRLGLMPEHDGAGLEPGQYVAILREAVLAGQRLSQQERSAGRRKVGWADLVLVAIDDELERLGLMPKGDSGGLDAEQYVAILRDLARAGNAERLARLGVCRACGSLLDLGSSYHGKMRTAAWCPACSDKPSRKIIVIDESYEAKHVRAADAGSEGDAPVDADDDPFGAIASALTAVEGGSAGSDPTPSPRLAAVIALFRRTLIELRRRERRAAGRRAAAREHLRDMGPTLADHARKQRYRASKETATEQPSKPDPPPHSPTRALDEIDAALQQAFPTAYTVAMGIVEPSKPLASKLAFVIRQAGLGHAEAVERAERLAASPIPPIHVIDGWLAAAFSTVYCDVCAELPPPGRLSSRPDGGDADLVERIRSVIARVEKGYHAMAQRIIELEDRCSASSTSYEELPPSPSEAPARERDDLVERQRTWDEAKSALISLGHSLREAEAVLRPRPGSEEM